jgi:hypothetical protein
MRSIPAAAGSLRRCNDSPKPGSENEKSLDDVTLEHHKCRLPLRRSSMSGKAVLKEDRLIRPTADSFPHHVQVTLTKCYSRAFEILRLFFVEFA